jgi:uroporphyrinogen-III decarboxylase
MEPKDRMLAALRGLPVDRLPVAPIYLHLYLAEAVRRRALAGYRAWMGHRHQVPVDPERVAAIQTRARRQAREWLGDSPDWIWTRPSAPAAWLSECVLQVEGEQLWQIHVPSGEREELSAPVAATDSTADRWEMSLPGRPAEVEVLVPAPTAEELLANGSLALASGLLDELGDQLFVCATMSSPFWRCYSVLGFKGLMTMPFDNPQLLHCLLQRQTAALVALARANAAIGVHGVFIEECLTSADVISPQVYDEFVYPYDLALLTELQALNLPTILYVCGDVSPRLPRLRLLAPTALAVEESKKGFRVDLAQVATAVGERMTIFGNLDATRIKEWDNAELARQIAGQVVAAQPARGFIASLGSPFPLDTPRERVAAFVAAARRVPPSSSARRC